MISREQSPLKENTVKKHGSTAIWLNLSPTQLREISGYLLMVKSKAILRLQGKATKLIS